MTMICFIPKKLSSQLATTYSRKGSCHHRLCLSVLYSTKVTCIFIAINIKIIDVISINVITVIDASAWSPYCCHFIIFRPQTPLKVDEYSFRASKCCFPRFCPVMLLFCIIVFSLYLHPLYWATECQMSSWYCYTMWKINCFTAKWTCTPDLQAS